MQERSLSMMSFHLHLSFKLTRCIASYKCSDLCVDLTRFLNLSLALAMYSMTDLQYQADYNVLSFSLASMSATTMYLWLRASAVRDKYKSAVKFLVL